MIYYFSESEATLITEDLEKPHEQIAPQNLPKLFKAIAKKRKQWSKIIIDMQTLTE
jgi:hypothetical protein